MSVINDLAVMIGGGQTGQVDRYLILLDDA